MEPSTDMEPPLAGVRKKRALDIDDFPKDARDREGPAKVGRAAKPVEEEKQVSEEDSDEEDSSDDDALGGLCVDKEDRKRLLQMPELEREMELTRRKEQQDDEELFKQLRRTQKGDASDQPEKDAADVRRSERKQASASKVTSKMESLNAMKASRDRQAEAKAQAQATPTARAEVGSPRARTDIEDAPPPPLSKPPARDDERHKESAALRSELESSDEEERRDLGSRRGRPDRGAGSPADVGYDLETESFEASAEEVLSMQVFRENLADWIKHPHLRETLTGAIVRVALTTNTQPGREASMCRITDVIDGNPYSFHGSQQQRVHSDKHLMIKTPTEETHPIQFSLVSNSWVSNEEFERFHDLRSKHKLEQISKREASDVKKQLGFAKSYTLSADDINRIVQQRKAKGLLKKPLNTQRVELLMEKRAAEEMGDDATLQRVTQELEEVLAKIKAKEMEQANVKPGDDEPLHKKLALVDKKAVAGNRTNMLSANKTADGRKSAGPDPYSRKRTVEKNYWSTGTDKVKAEAKAEQQEQVEIKKEVKTSRKEQLLKAVLPQPVMPLSKELLAARRLLGRRAVVFKPVEDRANRTTISLDTYITRLEEAKYSQLGL